MLNTYLIPIPINPDLGQVWTPRDIAMDMMRLAMEACGNSGPKQILDPACGPATFSKALFDTNIQVANLSCYDIDPRMISITKQVNDSIGFTSKTIKKDYLGDRGLENKFDLVIMNPPYIRQELIPLNEKEKYHQYLNKKLEVKIDRRSNLFVLFMLKGLVDLKAGGILCAVVYDAISQSQYGKKALTILNKHAELVSENTVQAPFNNVLIDAQVLVYRKRSEPLTEINHIKTFEHVAGNVALGQLLKSKRGTGLLHRKTFLAKEDEPYFEEATPFFCKQAKLSGLVVKPDSRAFLFESENSINEQLAGLLKEKLRGITVSSKLTHSAKTGYLLFNYYVRKAPRHLYNPDLIAASDNFYVSMPTGDFPPLAAWILLNSDAYTKPILSAGRNQGNGLTKLQMFEYKQASVPDWTKLTGSEIEKLVYLANKLVKKNASLAEITKTANKLVEYLNL